MTLTNLISRRLLVAVAAGSADSWPPARAVGHLPRALARAPTAPPAAVPRARRSARRNVPAAIADFSFNPAAITVAKGGTVTWANGGATTHTVTADEGGFDSCNLAGGATFTMKFDTAGTVAFHCKIHASMKGTITVTG